ncbi:YchJ family metal-binding protein [Chlamydiales bacterium]|nr:YchJ family metal-binding protein [Chlamydiales bacterium]
MKLCPCHSSKSYKTCCKTFHDGTLPNTPTELMRSRYSAYSMGLNDYIMKTTHPMNPQAHQSETPYKGLNFYGLTIITEKIDGDKGWVTFIANIKQLNQDLSFKEKSTFIKENGQWLYLAGEVVT